MGLKVLLDLTFVPMPIRVIWTTLRPKVAVKFVPVVYALRCSIKKTGKYLDNIVFTLTASHVHSQSCHQHAASRDTNFVNQDTASQLY